MGWGHSRALLLRGGKRKLVLRTGPNSRSWSQLQRLEGRSQWVWDSRPLPPPALQSLLLAEGKREATGTIARSFVEFQLQHLKVNIRE